MCNSKERKYESYKIIITYNNGEKEEINYKGINTSSFKAVKSLYDDVKEAYKNQSVNINFVGVSKNGELEIMWTKECISQERKKLKNIVETPTVDLVKEIKDRLEALKEKEGYCTRMKDFYNKQCDVTVHTIESFDKAKFANNNERDREKIKLFDKLQKERKIRRANKEDLKAIQKLHNYLSLDKTLIGVNNFLQSMSNTKEYEYLTKEKAAELKIMTEIPYKNSKDKIKLIKKLKNQYHKIVNDKANGKIICYNKAS